MFRCAMAITANHNRPRIKILFQQSLSEGDDEYVEENYEFVANAREDVLELVAEVRRLRELADDFAQELKANLCYWDSIKKEWDTMALSSARDACDYLVGRGKLLKVGDGKGRRQFYREVGAYG